MSYSAAMRFIVMHKVDANMEAGGPPEQRIINEMGQLVQGSLAAGVFLDGAGLHRSAQRVRLEFSRGERRVTKGPYAGSNELVAEMFQLKVASMDEAVDWATRAGAILGDAELELGPVVEPWDLGMFPKPTENLRVRVLVLRKGDAAYEAGAPLAPKVAAELAKLTGEMEEAGVFLGGHKLQPSRAGKRSRTSGGKRTWTDGPFAESKELIAGFSILELDSMEQAVEWANRYAGILGDNEVDIRRLDAAA
jgi:hypothetical protein